MNKRCSQIIHFLLEREDPVKVIDIAKNFQVSERIIRYDLVCIDEFLDHKIHKKLRRKRKEGIALSLTGEELRRVNQVLLPSKPGYYILNQEERCTFILSDMFNASSWRTYQTYENLLQVSKSSIEKDIVRIKKDLTPFQLRLHAEPGKGIKIDGNEKDIRRCIASILQNYLDLSALLNDNQISKSIQGGISSKVKELIDVEQLHPILSIIKEAERKLNRSFSDESFNQLILQLGLILKRISIGKTISIQKQEFNQAKKLKEYSVLVSLKTMNPLKFMLYEEELCYFAVFLKGAKESLPREYRNENWAEIQILVLKLIEEMDKRTPYHFAKDKELYKSLCLHLGPTIYRLRNDVQPYQNNVQFIRNTYPEMFNYVKKALHLIEKHIGIEMQESDISYIVLHFCSSLERARRSMSKFKIAITCGHGFGAAKLIEETLNSKFQNIDIILSTAVHLLEEMKNIQADLIVSTAPLHIENIPVIVVKPILTKQDLSKIEQFLYENIPSFTGPSQDHTTFFKEVLEIANNNSKIFSQEKLINELSNCFYKNGMNFRREAVQPMLGELLQEEFTRFEVEAKNWQDAIMIGGGILVENGCVHPSYVNEMIDSVKTMGPYVVIHPGIALPHARPENGVKKLGISLINLKKPIHFGNPDNDPVYTVICLAATDNFSHLKALSKIVEIINNEKTLEELQNAKNYQELDQLLE
ncbi:BglG family transcription antiterminator [Metabacillus arenae]|uniref:BglG family transcription antiterminator n=1 Tax=Metabacillus arenae TaxID=2771434 RepID=A0A926RYP4_9BACI|nr:BglG family transcription antiterminator [Metabacillus arenae]MBD1381980.1 BglG family transcription antiterminator [Metabacillus arenae]